MDYRIEKLEKFNDKRGQLVVFLKDSDLNKNLKQFGQIYFVTFDGKGIVRGNHYHRNIREWFGVVNGKVEVSLVDIKTKEKVKIILNADSKKYVRLEIGPNIAHGFKSLSGNVALLNYTDKEWESSDVIAYETIQ